MGCFHGEMSLQLRNCTTLAHTLQSGIQTQSARKGVVVDDNGLRLDGTAACSCGGQPEPVV